jgi:2,3,4,5-tetrahydropyridine-2,6-dicarboxylate N-succinyltransferase
MSTQLSNTIENGWDNRANISTSTQGEVREAVDTVLAALDAGTLRVAEKKDGAWVVNQWVKQAILLSFRLNDNEIITGPQQGGVPAAWFDKVPMKFKGWSKEQFVAAGFRAVPGCFVRSGSFIDTGVVLMPSFINIGARVGKGTMVDTWVTIGSCAQIGANCHISGGVGIGGVLEPLQANPVIIEDNCFIGARSEIAEGVIVEEGAVISMGVFIGASTKIIDRASGEVFYGRVPAYSVVVPGTMSDKNPLNPSLACAVIVKRVDEKTRSKTSINELLRA